MEGFNRGEKSGSEKKKGDGRKQKPYFIPGGFEELEPSSSNEGSGGFGNIGADDLTPFGTNEDISTEGKNVKGMIPTPDDILNIPGSKSKKKNIKPKDPRKPPHARYDPTDPFGGGPDPDPDHERPFR